jgi:hypothetical protein
MAASSIARAFLIRRVVRKVSASVGVSGASSLKTPSVSPSWVTVANENRDLALVHTLALAHVTKA